MAKGAITCNYTIDSFSDPQETERQNVKFDKIPCCPMFNHK